MTQRQFAEHLGISYNTVRNWIHYNRVPALTDANNIAFIFGVTLNYLLNGKDRDITALRLREIEARKAAARILDMMDKIQKQLMLIRPLSGNKKSA